MAEKTRLDHLAEATSQELLSELTRRRMEALFSCSDQEIADELARRGVELVQWDPPIDDQPPRLVEK